MVRLATYICVLSCIVCAMSCVTTKKRDEASKVGKMYHDITSKYNRNFNANLLIDETSAQILERYQDDYSEILPIYPLLEKENPTQLAEPMDQAIEKASVAIAIHRPSHWTDDNYLIIGRAQYLKEDYESAEATFRYLIKHYDPSNLIAASAPKSRNVNAKVSKKEKEQEKKEAEKERQDRVKERKRDIARAEKERKKRAKKQRKARTKNRKQEIKRREDLARSKAKQEQQAAKEDKDVANNDKGKNKKQKPFDENPDLPKVKGNPTNYFLKHKPVYQEAQLWLAKTLIERDRFGEAENLLRTMDSKSTTFDEIREQIPIVQAHSALSRFQIPAAIEPLRKAVEVTKNKEERARYAFILAQVLEHTKRFQDAQLAYEQVVKLKPNYEMNFNAQLNKLKMQTNAGSFNSDKYAHELEKMIKDDKNTEYKDQLYFALAQRDLEAGNLESAIENLRESVRNSVGNKVQKSESYYTLAGLYFDRHDYISAKLYFDSTLMLMNSEDPRLEQVTTYAKNLSQISENLQIIELQDSLIKISKMSDKERKALAAQIKKEAARAEAAAQAAALNASSGGRNLPQIGAVANRTATGQNQKLFFAYDDRQVKKGLRDFGRVWGNVALQDNWRRSNSSSYGALAAVGEGSEDQGVAQNISETEIDEIFDRVPKTPEELEMANKEIEDALFALGRLYRSELESNEKTIEALERLLNDYPETEHMLDAYYLLYVAYTDEGNTGRADHYAQKIISDHADSEYARYINDPSYLENALDDDEKVEQFYQDVHALYDQGKYEIVLKRLLNARTTLPPRHGLQSKFSLLSALCIGRLQGRESYVNALKELIAKYPETDEEERAKEIIRLLGIRFTETTAGIEEINQDTYFALTEKDKMHLILVSLQKNASGKEREAVRSAFSNYNKKYHKLDKLSVSMIILGEEKDQPLIVIRRFDSKEKAMAYYDGFQSNGKDFIPDLNTIETFASSQTNYRKIVQLRSVDLYREFFSKEYLSN